MTTTTFTTHHALRAVESNRHDEHRRFADFVRTREPQLLDFQAYVTEDHEQLRLIFSFRDSSEAERATSTGSVRESAWLGLLAGATVLCLLAVGIYLGNTPLTV
jgi:hypothetical protein